jgi:hypothetical protein
MKRVLRAACLAAVALAGCARTGASLIPARTVSAAADTTAQASISITIPAPAKSASSALRRARYISSATKSMTVAVAGQPTILVGLTPGSPGCSVVSSATQCTVRASLPVGTYPVTITLYGSLAGNTDPLAIATAVQTIAANTTNNLAFTLNAVVSLVYLSLSPDGTFVSGTPATKSVIVSPRDSSNATIVLGTDAIVDQYGSPVTIRLGVTDTTGALSVSPSTAGGTPSTLSYNGGAPNGLNVTASLRDASNAQLTQAQTTVTLTQVNTGPQGPTTTYYVKGMSNSSLVSAGQAMRATGASGLVILDFGYPFQCIPYGVTKGYCTSGQLNQYGTFLPPAGQWVTNDQIAAASKAYLDGFAGNSAPAGGQHIVLAIGTANFCLTAADCNGDLYAAYGSQWGAMVSSVQQYIVSSNRSSYEQAAAANDIETWCGTDNAAVCTIGSGPTKRWLAAYSLNTSQPMFDFGSLDGCGIPGNCSVWTPNDFWEMTSTQSYYAIPEVYCDAMATPWANLAAWAAANEPTPLRIAGTLTSSTFPFAPGCSFDTQPLDGFNLMHTKLLTSAPASATGMVYYTDIHNLF